MNYIIYVSIPYEGEQCILNGGTIFDVKNFLASYSGCWDELTVIEGRTVDVSIFEES